MSRFLISGPPPQPGMCLCNCSKNHRPTVGGCSTSWRGPAGAFCPRCEAAIETLQSACRRALEGPPVWGSVPGS